ncbi:phosphoinositide phosphatase SAC3-like [Nymphaea colorata]|nr:phosphoinositide phosphatase SAC3-like [Nymphaea colorata]
MTSENEQCRQIEDEAEQPADHNFQQFKLYETRSNFYMIGRDKNRISWRVLKIDRSETSELNILEDSTIYTEDECYDLLKRINEGNKATGGLKFVTKCYGIVGFVKFLGPYYMLVITKRKQIGAICGHTVYAIAKSEMIALPHSTVESNMTYSKYENRYKRLLCAVDLTKDFFFSYSYHVMRSLQMNVCDREAGQVVYETMFVWNEFLTRGIRKHLKNTIWTVALVYGFFKQAKLSICGKDFNLALIARRSRHFAGTRYLKRGVNDQGSVANDVETEQIVYEDVPEGSATQISSVVQNRGSIPLFWSQETSRLNIRPDIVLLKKDEAYEATRLHFKNLVERYGNPIIVLNLVKTNEKKPRESILRVEFANAINHINKDLSEKNRLKFLHWDLHKHYKSNAENVLAKLGKVAKDVLEMTGFFFGQLTPSLEFEGCLSQTFPDSRQNGGLYVSGSTESNNSEDSQDAEFGNEEGSIDMNASHVVKDPMFQTGVLRTNCIDCLDRTNVAQYAYGLAALGQQLYALGLTDDPTIDLDAPLAEKLMEFYERMGDTLALQYGGSPAHNKIFSERRGQWKPATQSQEFFRTLQRYYNNAYMDAEKQNAINLFLGNFQPQVDKPALWELHHNVGRTDENARVLFKRSLSDGSILCDGGTPLSITKDVGIEKHGFSNSALPEISAQENSTHDHSDSKGETSTSEHNISYSRFVPLATRRQLFPDMQGDSSHDSDASEHSLGKISSSSNFVDVDWLSSSDNSSDEIDERSALINSLGAGQSSENMMNGISAETTPSQSENGGSSMEATAELEEMYQMQKSGPFAKLSDNFARWVIFGQTLCN